MLSAMARHPGEFECGDKRNAGASKTAFHFSQNITQPP